MVGLSYDVAHLLAGGLVLLSLMLLYQDRMYALLNVFAAHAIVLALAVAWQAWVQDAPHLYITALIALCSRARSSRSRCTGSSSTSAFIATIETVVGDRADDDAGHRLIALSIMVMRPVTDQADVLTREDLAFALSVILLGC